MVTSRDSQSGAWNEAAKLVELNTAGDEVFPSVTADGLSLFFADRFSLPGSRPDKLGQADIWVSTRENPGGQGFFRLRKP